jgi:hypothetical protein
LTGYQHRYQHPTTGVGPVLGQSTLKSAARR